MARQLFHNLCNCSISKVVYTDMKHVCKKMSLCLSGSEKVNFFENSEALTEGNPRIKRDITDSKQLY